MLNHCKALNDHVDEEDKTDGVTIRDAIGREQNPVLINESGLYSLVRSMHTLGGSQDFTKEGEYNDNSNHGGDSCRTGMVHQAEQAACFTACRPCRCPE